MITLETGSFKLLLHEPGDGFYRGTRFDAAGISGGLDFAGLQMCGPWFGTYDPYAHDAVCGPAEEFTPIGFDGSAPGGTFVKPGVGVLLRPDSAPYDRFRLYPVHDPGMWTVERGTGFIAFTHRLKGVYEYRKEFVLTGERSFDIRHSLDTLGPELSGEVYNHNFWTFGRMEVGPSRRMDFPFVPEGRWRAAYDSVAIAGSGIRFSRTLREGESVYMGDIHCSGGQGMPYEMDISEGNTGVRVSADVPASHTVLWANHRVACLEPYSAFTAHSKWTISYELYEKN